MFFDIFSALCQQRGVSRYKACTDIGLNRAAVAKWKNGAIPTGSTLSKMADYFGVTTDYLLGGEQKEKAPTPKDEREITFDDFTYAMQNETKDLTEMDKQILLSMAKQLSDARKKKDGQSG